METTQASLDHLTWENPMGEARKDAYGYQEFSFFIEKVQDSYEI